MEFGTLVGGRLLFLLCINSLLFRGGGWFSFIYLGGFIIFAVFRIAAVFIFFSAPAGTLLISTDFHFLLLRYTNYTVYPASGQWCIFLRLQLKKRLQSAPTGPRPNRLPGKKNCPAVRPGSRLREAYQPSFSPGT